jgi:glutamine---fructose-6-phosphate transaminase (isomerizing)
MSDKVSYQSAITLQPEALRQSRTSIDAALRAADLAPLARGTVLLTAIGASLYTAYAGAAQMRRQGIRAFALPATDLQDPQIDLAEAYVAISASGRSVEPAKAMEIRPKVATYGVAKAADCPLAKVVRTMIPTGSGPDSSPNVTSYTGSLLALGLLADRIGLPSGTHWATLPDKADALLRAMADPIERAVALLAERAAIDCVGQGAAFGTAGYAALMLREASRIVAQSWDTLNFLHGPMEPHDRRTGVILFGDGREVQLARDLADFGIPSVLMTHRVDITETPGLVVIPMPSGGSGLADAILHAIPAQLLASGLAEAAGLPECNFRYRQSDTKLAMAE